MTEFGVVSVTAARGQVHTLRLRLETNATPGEVRLDGIVDQGSVTDQLRAAREIALRFLLRPDIQPAVKCPIDQGTLVVEGEGLGRVHGPSFGLAFITACLGLALGVRLRTDRYFSAGIRVGNDQGMHRVELIPVEGMPAKWSATELSGGAELFMYGDEESLKSTESAYYVHREMLCRPIALQRVIPTASLIGLALDADEFSHRMSESGSAALPLVLGVLAAVPAVPYASAYPAGIGRLLAKWRGEQILDRDVDLRVLMQIPNASSVPVEQVVQHLYGRIAAAADDPEIQADLIRGLFASDAEEPAWVQSVDHVPNAPDQTALGRWLDRVQIADAADLHLVLQVLGYANRYAPDIEPYWPAAKRVLDEGMLVLFRNLVQQLSAICQQLTQVPKDQQEKALQQMLHPYLVAERLAAFRPDWIAPSVQLLQQVAREFRLGRPEASIVQWMQVRFERVLVDHVINEFRDASEERLVLTYSRHNEESTDTAASPLPLSPAVNDLVLMVSGSELQEIRIPSPVLLLESTHGVPSYCRRVAFRPNDDTFARLPAEPAKEAYSRYASADEPNLIRFRFQKSEQMVAVRWAPQLNHWPPAIDSQLFVAAMDEFSDSLLPHSVFDVGCGTGYLGMAAACCWPSIRDVHLCDIEASAVAAASRNAELNGFPRDSIHVYCSDFTRFNRSVRTDMLVCCPPYLPNRPLPIQGIELATNGTRLLEHVVRSGARHADEVWLAFSSLAWHEFILALCETQSEYRRIEVLRRDFVPLRIPWLMPFSPDEQGDKYQYEANRRYYYEVLHSRGLIDLDESPVTGKPVDPMNYVETHQVQLSEVQTQVDLRCVSDEEVVARLESLKGSGNSRGFRQWHEVRVVRLIAS